MTTKLKPGFYYDGDRVVDANGKLVSLEVAAAEPENVEMLPEATDDEKNLETIVAAFFSRTSGLELLDGESSVDYVERAATSYKNLAQQVESQRTQFDSSYKEATDKIDQLTAQAETTKSDLDAANAQATQLTQERDGLQAQVDKFTKDAADAKKKSGGPS